MARQTVFSQQELLANLVATDLRPGPPDVGSTTTPESLLLLSVGIMYKVENLFNLLRRLEGDLGALLETVRR